MTKRNFSRNSRKQEIFVSVGLFELILITMMPHGPRMVPIVLGAHITHSNEWAGLNMKHLKLQFLSNRM